LRGVTDSKFIKVHCAVALAIARVLDALHSY
jgi:hypothetical protein